MKAKLRQSQTKATEGDAENPLTFTFTRSGQYSSALTVYYTLSGIAEPGLDYSPQSDFDTIYSVSIPGGGTSNSAQVQMTAEADDLWEGDEHLMLSLRSNSNYWLSSSRTASGTIEDVAVNLAMDSNNNGVIGQSDEAIEDDATKPGKIVSVNADDADSDGVPDWADGYGRFSDTPILENSSSTQFVPLTLALSSGVDLSTATVQFDYEASDPLGVTRSGAGTQQDPYVYALPTTGGPMRLWTKDGSQSRDGVSAGAGGDWIEPGQALNVSDLFGTSRTVQLWVEAVKPSAELGDLRIEASVDPDGAGSEASHGDAARLTAISLQMAVDGNRDGSISYAGEDKTTPNSPYRFWLNDDHDEVNGDVYGGPLDGNDNKIKNTRDLEDFAPLKVGYSPLLMDGLIDEISFRFTNAQQNPSIRLWSVGGELSRLSTYLTDEQTAQTIVDSYGDSHQFRRVFTDEYVMPWSTFANDFYASAENATVSSTPMLWEGVTQGAGQLTVSLIKNGQVFASSQVDLDLKPIKQFYEAWTITDSSGAPVGNTITWPNPRDVGTDPSVPITPIPSTFGLISDSSPASIEERANYSKDYILFVHGWRMTPEERRSFAETAYKRLFWQGFKGRFGLFSWPTEWVDTNNYAELFGTPAGRRNYDNSEMKAYASGAALRNLIKSLDNAGYSVNLYAHSMGNIVASEALREEAIGTNPQKIVHTYVASQAASVASVDDPNVDADLKLDPNDDQGGGNRRAIGGDNHGSTPGNRGSFYGSVNYGISAATDANGKARVTFQVTMQPGDNFRIAAALSNLDLDKLTTFAPGEPTGPDVEVVQPNNEQLAGNAGVGLTEMLTVWRRLWIERDVMSGVTANIVNVSITGVTVNSPQPGTGGGNDIIQLAAPLMGGQENVIFQKDEFEGGTLIIPAFGKKLPIYLNSRNYSGDQPAPDTLNVPANSFSQAELNAIASGPVAATVVDDDVIPASGNMHLPDGGPLLQSAFGDAYILPVYADGGALNPRVLVPFVRHLNDDTPAGARDLPSSSASFWATYVIGAFENIWSTDGDPDLTAPAGIGIPSPSSDAAIDYGYSTSDTSYIFLETINDYVRQHVNYTDEWHTVAHEIGHTVGSGNDTHSATGIMKTAAPKGETVFDNYYQNEFRASKNAHCRA